MLLYQWCLLPSGGNKKATIVVAFAEN